MEELGYLVDFVNNYKTELIVGASVLGWYTLKLGLYLAAGQNIRKRKRRGENVSSSLNRFRRGKFFVFSPPPLDAGILIYSWLIGD